MLSPLRNRFGIPGAISVIALVFAMLGGAYAASNDGGKATASAKAKRGPRGPRGPQGPAGPAGPQGPAGAKGDNGAAGANGKDGANGINGTNGAAGATGEDGKSVTSSPVPLGEPTCDEQGGAEYEVEGGEATLICNGKEGSPWTAAGTLPPGATESGVWSSQVSAETITADVENETKEVQIGASSFVVPISFPIKLPFQLHEEHIHFGKAGEVPFSSSCPGTLGNPQAAPGELCVYKTGTSLSNASFEGVFRLGAAAGSQETNQAGAFLFFLRESPDPASVYGSFAVTGCEEDPGNGVCKP
jgi:hypothetical protein